MTGAPHYPTGSGDGFAFSQMDRAEKAELRIAALTRTVADLIQALEAVRVLSEACGDQQLAIISRNAIDKAKGGQS